MPNVVSLWERFRGNTRPVPGPNEWRLSHERDMYSRGGL